MSKKNKNRGLNDNIKYVLFAVIIIVVIALIGFCAYKILETTKESTKPKIVEKNVKEIEGYNIHVDDTDTDLYRNEYSKLKENLESNEIDYDSYAQSVAKMFIIDLYTIKNKLNKYDVGGIDFVLPSALENYKTNVTDTIYKYVEDNSNNNRSQQLPVVKSITITNTKKDKFKIESDNKKYDSYIFDISWTYSQDLGYDIKGEVIVIRKDNKMYVVEKN